MALVMEGGVFYDISLEPHQTVPREGSHVIHVHHFHVAMKLEDCANLWMFVSSLGLLKKSINNPVSRRIQLGLIYPFWRKAWANITSWSHF